MVRFLPKICIHARRNVFFMRFNGSPTIKCRNPLMEFMKIEFQTTQNVARWQFDLYWRKYYFILMKTFYVSSHYSLILLSVSILKNVNNVSSCLAFSRWFEIHGDFRVTNSSSREYESFDTMSRIRRTYHRNRFACITHS